MRGSWLEVVRPLRRWAGRVEAAQVRWFGASALSLLYRRPVLVLETTGRRSGRRRRTVVAYRVVEDQLVVVGGAGGQARRPDWVANLLADPRVVVTLRRRRQEMSRAGRRTCPPGAVGPSPPRAAGDREVRAAGRPPDPGDRPPRQPLSRPATGRGTAAGMR